MMAEDITRRGIFGAWLWEKVEQTDLSQADLARAIGIPQSALSNYVNGKALPERRSLRKIAGYFHMDETELRQLVVRSESARSVPDELPPVDSTGGEYPPEVETTVQHLDRDRYMRPEVREWLKEIVRREYWRARGEDGH